MAKENYQKSHLHTLISLIGILFILFGIFAGVRTMINLILFDRYPTAGAIPIYMFSGGMNYGPREEDCLSYPPIQVLPINYENMPVEKINIQNINLEPIQSSSPPVKIDNEKVADKENAKKAYEKQQQIQAEFSKKSCLASAKAYRDQTKANDISLSLFFLFIGIGLLVSRRYLK